MRASIDNLIDEEHKRESGWYGTTPGFRRHLRRCRSTRARAPVEPSRRFADGAARRGGFSTRRDIGAVRTHFPPSFDVGSRAPSVRPVDAARRLAPVHAGDDGDDDDSGRRGCAQLVRLTGSKVAVVQVRATELRPTRAIAGWSVGSTSASGRGRFVVAGGCVLRQFQARRRVVESCWPPVEHPSATSGGEDGHGSPARARFATARRPSVVSAAMTSITLLTMPVQTWSAVDWPPEASSRAPSQWSARSSTGG